MGAGECGVDKVGYGVEIRRGKEGRGGEESCGETSRGRGRVSRLQGWWREVGQGGNGDADGGGWGGSDGRHRNLDRTAFRRGRNDMLFQ